MITNQTFLNENGFQVYCDFRAMQQHFTTKSYDYFKYNGKIRASYDTFVTRRDAYQFQKLSKKRDHKSLILSNMIENPKIWVGSLLENEAESTYLAWKKRNDSITIHIKDQLSFLKDEFKNNFAVRNGSYPYVIDLYIQRGISLETLSILTSITNSKQYWLDNVVDKVLFPDIIFKIDKYHPFIIYSSEKVKKVLKDHFF